MAAPAQFATSASVSGFAFASCSDIRLLIRALLPDIRIPFRVNDDGLYTFRYHQDMGLGSFMGVDGPEFRPGNTWGHVETAGTALLVGDHEWEVLVSVTQPRAFTCST